jgi:hypothetical protein
MIFGTLYYYYYLISFDNFIQCLLLDSFLKISDINKQSKFLKKLVILLKNLIKIYSKI